MRTNHRCGAVGTGLAIIAGAALLVGCQTNPDSVTTVDSGPVDTAGIEDFPRIAARKQQEPVWCWAACAEMILAYHGQAVSQEQIVERVHGEIARLAALRTDEYNRPIPGQEQHARIVQAATLDEILWAMNPDMQSMRERLDSVRADLQAGGQQKQFGIDINPLLGAEWTKLTSKDPDEIVPSLQARQPAIFVSGGMDGSGMGHAEVAFKVDYIDKRLDRSGSIPIIGDIGGTIQKAGSPLFDSYEIVRLYSVDPANGQIRTHSGDEVKDFALYVTKGQARRILEKRLNAINTSNKSARR